MSRQVWGLDFGDCHRSMRAHTEAVTSVKFIPRTHLVVTCSKDKTVKYWDADHFEQVQSLPFLPFSLLKNRKRAQHKKTKNRTYQAAL